MKGISTVIATILMLMITIGLAGTAYLFISGAFQQQTQGLEVVDAFCSGGTSARITMRNVGTSDISFDADDCTVAANSATCGSIRITRTSGLGTFAAKGSTAADAVIEPGTTATLISDGCTTTGNPSTCVYRITPPSGRSIVATVSCTG